MLVWVMLVWVRGGKLFEKLALRSRQCGRGSRFYIPDPVIWRVLARKMQGGYF
jgi:hypothetical protein